MTTDAPSPSSTSPGATAPGTNGFAITALVLGILGFACGIVAVLALVFGYKAVRQIDASNGAQTGRGMATAGIVLGWVWLGLIFVYVLFLFYVLATSG